MAAVPSSSSHGGWRLNNSSDSSAAGAPQEPQRIREDFSRILEGLQPSSHERAGPFQTTSSIPAYSAFGPPTGLAPSQEQGYRDQSSGYSSGASLHRSPMPTVRWEDQFLTSENLKAGYPGGGGGDFASENQVMAYKGLNMMHMFPFLFSFCCFLIFMMPISSIVHLSHDPNIIYWSGNSYEGALLLPSLFFVAFFVHVRLQRPHKPTVLLVLLVPAVVLLVMGDILTAESGHKADSLLAADCDSFPEKRQLQRSWEAAQRLYNDCLEETVPMRNLTMETARRLFRIQDCEEFKEAYSTYAKDWDYLWYLEEEHNCAGWCHFGDRLFTFKEVVDSCATVVSQVFLLKVQRMAKQVVVMTIFIMVGTSLGNIVLGPGLRALGMDWDW